VTARTVSVVLIPPSLRHRMPGETFAVIRETPGRPGVEVLATDADVPAGVHPEEYGRRCAAAGDDRYAGLGRGIQFGLKPDGSGWQAWDFLACAPHSVRDCSDCRSEGASPSRNLDVLPSLTVRTRKPAAVA
jgi:hypothetical protein